MDCASFFEELKQEFLSRGMSFRYEPDRLCYGDIFKFSNPTTKTFSNYANLKFEKKSNKRSKSEKYCPTKENQCDKFCYSNKAPFFLASRDDVEYFVDMKDMVYRIALKLARKIGRLPDALHARMILSTDDHPAVKRYIREYC